MKIEPVTLTGRHVRIVPMESHHAQDLFEAGNHPEIWTYMPANIATMADMDRLVQHALARRDSGLDLPFVIQDAASGRLVGSTRFLDISVADRHLEIGWTWLTPKAWRSAVNTECKYLLLRHCFETLRTIRVQIKTDARNVRSQRAIERIGGVREGTLRKHRIMHDGHIRDSVYFSILDDEWPQVKMKLEGMMEQSV